MFILLVTLQVGLFNEIHLFGLATPLLYIYFVIKLPVDMNRNVVMILSALIGLVIDMLSFTLGINVLACVFIGFFRFYFLKLFSPRDVFESYSPSFSTFGIALFLRYAALMTLLHQVVLYTAESFSLFEPVSLSLRIGGSFILTLLLIFAFESITFKKSGR
jgi:rod shape-determining protein MreD